MEKDELFGTMTYDGFWRGETRITLFGEHHIIALYINGEEEDGITLNQRKAFIDFQSSMDRVIDETEKSIFSYYQDNYENYRAMKNSLAESDRIAPKISAKNELSRLVKPTGLLIDYDFGDSCIRIGILCDCTWEPEHGIGVLIMNNKVAGVGLQDIVL